MSFERTAWQEGFCGADRIFGHGVFVNLESFLAEIRESGCLDSEGVFTLDTTAADKKLEEMYRALGVYWPLKLVQAAAYLSATRVDFQTNRDGLVFLLECPKKPPSLLELGDTGEYCSYIRDALRIVEATQPGLESLLILQWENGGPGEFLQARIGADAQVFALPDGAADEIAKQAGWSSSQTYHLVLEMRLDAKSWWARLRNRLRLTIQIKQVLKERAQYSPVPVVVDGRGLGQGVADTAVGGQTRSTSAAIGFGLTDLQNELAAEYVLGPTSEDVLVRVREPGNGSVFVRAFHGELGPLGYHPRALSKWTRELNHPLFPECPDPSLGWFRAPPETDFADWQNDPRYQDSEYIPVTLLRWEGRQDRQDRQVLRRFVETSVRLAPEFVLAKGQSKFQAQGLPCYCCLTLSKKPVGPGLIKFYRRGVFLEEHQADLGLPGARAYVACSQLELDLSGFGVIRNDIYQQLLEDLRSRALELASETLTLGDQHDLAIKPLKKALQKALS